MSETIASARTPQHVLIAEDSPVQAKKLAFLLSGDGYRVSWASNGRQALEIARTDRPALLISDVMMPEVGGYDLCRAIKEDPDLCGIPVLLLTSLSDPHDIIRGLQCGADNFVTKPYDHEHLLSRVRYLLASRALRAANPAGMVLEIVFRGETFAISSERYQILDLLLSVFEAAVQRNEELLAAEHRLQSLNADLELKVSERTSELRTEIAERIRSESQVLRLNQVLIAVREINQLIARTKDRGKLLQQACELLVTEHACQGAALVFMTPREPLAEVQLAGQGPAVLAGGLMGEGGRLSAERDLVVAEQRLMVLGDGGSDAAGTKGAVLLPICHGLQTYGLLAVGGWATEQPDSEALGLFHKVAGDLGFALYSIELDEARRQAEQVIIAQARFFDENPNPMLRVSAAGHLLYANPGSAELLHAWQAEPGTLVPEGCRADVQAALADGAPRVTEHCAGGRIYRFTVAPVPDSGYCNLFAADETERRRAQDLLAVRTELAEQADGLDEAELLQLALDRAEALTGSEISFYHLVEADGQHIQLQAWSTRTTAQYCQAPVELRHYKASDAGLWAMPLHTLKPVIHNDFASLTAKPAYPEGHAHLVREVLVPVLRDGRVVAIMGVGNKATDYTADDVAAIELLASLVSDHVLRKQAQAALAEAEQFTRATIDALPSRLCVLDASGVILAVNETWRTFYQELEHGTELFGEGSNYLDSCAKVADEVPGLQAVARGVREVIHGEQAEFSLEYSSDRSGTERWFTVRASRFPGDGPVRVVLVATEVTQMVLAEQERAHLETQLRQQQKLESIGTLAGGVAHEINNPIMGVQNYAQLILDGIPSDSEEAEFAREILHETERIATIVRNLLQFARHEKQSHSPACMADIVSGTLSLVRTVLRHDQISLEVDVPGDLPAFKCRSQQIQQVVMNLLTNSRDALNERYQGYDENKRISLTCRAFEQDGQTWLRLTVADQGAGIPAAIAARILDPFFTTKGVEKGTGLGLAVSHGIVVDHGGRLTFETELGQGTRFHVELPVDNGWEL